MNTVKDRLGMLLGRADRQPASHYKRLIAPATRPFFQYEPATAVDQGHFAVHVYAA